MGREGEQINIERGNIKRHCTSSLYSIYVERNFFGPADASDLSYRFYRANLIISIHNRDEDGRISNRSSNVVGINAPIPINWQIRRFEAKAFQILTGMQYRMMFN